MLMFAFVIALIVLIANEKTDTNTSVFTFILYLPYVFLLCIYNGTLIRILISFFKVSLLSYLFPIIPFIVWFIISNYSITIRFWKLNEKEVIIGLIIMALINLFGYVIYNPEKKY